MFLILHFKNSVRLFLLTILPPFQLIIYLKLLISLDFWKRKQFFGVLGDLKLYCVGGERLLMTVLSASVL